MCEWVRFRKNQDMAVIKNLLVGMLDRDSQGFILDCLGKSVQPGSDRDTKRFKETLALKGIPFGFEAMKMDEGGKP